MDLKFISIRDITPPTLEVLFDGKQILDGDVVSNTPQIDFFLRDENPFLMVSNPDLIFFQLFKVEGFDEFEIVPSPGEIQLAFDSGRNELNVIFNPEELTEGDYLIRANARDFTGNKAGFLYYQVEFSVASYEGITKLNFFPNPFITGLNISFFLSGNQLPDQFELHFYNRQGRKELVLDIRDKIKLGSNRIYNVWDGKSKNGLSLEGGLYFVKLVSGSNGHLLPVGGTNGSSIIEKHGFAKLIYFPPGR